MIVAWPRTHRPSGHSQQVRMGPSAWAIDRAKSAHLRAIPELEMTSTVKGLALS